MKALVTGATGFLGSALTRKLLDEGHEVAVVRRPTSDARRIADLLSRVVEIRGDLTSPAEIEPAILDFAPDTIFHLAWHGVGNRLRNDISQVNTNLTANLALLRMTLKTPCRTWVGLGSQAEYGPHDRPLDETTPVGPVTLYGTVKLCTWLLTKQLLAQANIRTAWLRLFSIYGPGDNPDFMIPTLVRKLLAGERPSLTPGDQLWDYLYVIDAAEAVYRVAACEAAEGVFNLGSGSVRTIRSIVEAIRDRIDRSLPLGFGEVPYRADHPMLFQADVKRVRDVTGWQPRTSIEEGLRQTIEWHRTQDSKERAHADKA
jgi:UDP-glucose 4-epimerase